MSLKDAIAQMISAHAAALNQLSVESAQKYNSAFLNVHHERLRQEIIELDRKLKAAPPQNASWSNDKNVLAVKMTELQKIASAKKTLAHMPKNLKMLHSYLDIDYLVELKEVPEFGGSSAAYY